MTIHTIDTTAARLLSRMVSVTVYGATWEGFMATHSLAWSATLEESKALTLESLKRRFGDFQRLEDFNATHIEIWVQDVRIEGDAVQRSLQIARDVRAFSLPEAVELSQTAEAWG